MTSYCHVNGIFCKISKTNDNLVTKKKMSNSHVPQLCANVNFIYIIDYDVISDSAKKNHACVGKTK